MIAKKQFSSTQNTVAEQSRIVCYKGNRILLSNLQRLFFIILSNGNKYSSHQLMQLLKTSDPRKEIHYLRCKGINVQDEWKKATSTIARHKRYWINPDDCIECMIG